MRTIFMGAPQFAVPTLERLVAIGANVVAVYTKAPKPGGRRGLGTTKTAVHLKAEELGLQVWTPVSLKSDAALEELQAFEADVAIVAAYGLILPPGALVAPRYGCLNLHGSLLPRWRGAAPIQRAIMAGDFKTGVELMRMEEGLDTGPVAGSREIAIKSSDTTGSLTERLAILAAELVEQNWPRIVSRSLVFHAQPMEGITYAKKIEKYESAIDWRADSETVRRQIHGLSPAPGAYSLFTLNGRLERIKFLKVEACEGSGAPGEVMGPDFRIACGVGAIRAIEAQRAGRPPAKAADIWRGARFEIGSQFLQAEATTPT